MLRFGMDLARRLSAGALLALALLLPAPGYAQNADPNRGADQLLAGWDRTAAVVETALESGSINDAALDRLRNAMTDQRAAAKTLAERLEAEAAPLRAQLEALGPKPEEGAPEAADVAERRKELNDRLTQIEGRAKQAELAATRAEAIEQRLASFGRTLLADKLLNREPGVGDWRIWKQAAESARTLLAGFAGGAVAAISSIEPFGDDAPLLAGLIAVIAFWVLGQRRLAWVIDRLIAAARVNKRVGAQIFYAVLLVLARIAGPVASALVIVEIVEAARVLPTAGELFLWRLAQGVIIVALTSALARIYFAPRLAETRIIDLGDVGARRAVWRVTFLATLIAIHRVVLDPAAAAGADPAFLTVANAIIAIIAGPLLFTLFRNLCRKFASAEATAAPADAPPSDDEEHDEIDVAATLLAALRFLGGGAAVVVLLAAVLGYRELSQFLLYRVSLTAAIMALAGIVYVIVRRVQLGEDEEAARTPLTTVIATLILALVLAPVLAFVWGASIADLRALGVQLLEGVTIGGATYSLTDVIAALLVVVIGVWLTRLAQGVTRRAVLPSTRLDTGARNSLLTGIGYIGFIITAIIAFSAAGLDLSNLALVAGALSVGIGFGLQNIVNNFVSGVILLVERPVKVGDWIVVGEAQGYVRRINVRSTEIETFDRASIIVPNSDLISNQVLNWTHKNLTGRCLVKVGVSYDSDPEQVIKIMRETALAHPMTLRYPAPFITFDAFGDSALEFEARVYIRDVNWVLSVKSDLNLAILKRLREEGIEVPFPQRDLHIRSGLPAMTAAAPAETSVEARPNRQPISDLAKPDIDDADAES